MAIEVADSLIVKFSAGADSTALVVLELDDFLNEGKTSFAPLDIINFRLHHGPGVQLSKMAATDGMVASQGSGQRDLEAQLLWTETKDSHELPYLLTGSLEVGYYGSQAEGLRRSGDRSLIIDGGVLPALSLVKYQAEFSYFKLLTPDIDLADDESYPISIVAYMEGV